MALVVSGRRPSHAPIASATTHHETAKMIVAVSSWEAATAIDTNASAVPSAAASSTVDLRKSV